MFSHRPFTPLLALAATLASAQTSTLCNSDFSSANSTSVASMNFNTAHLSIHSRAVTVSSDNANGDQAATSIWYDPGSADYSNNTLLGYDLCALVISNIPTNTNRLAQSGGCSAMLSQSCTDVIRSRAATEALRLTSDAENLGGSISEICSSIGASLGDDGNTWPTECQNALGEGSGEDVAEIEAMGHNTSGLETSCKLHGAGKTFDRVERIQDSDISYDDATRQTWPILSVYMPVANPKRMMSIGNVYTSLNCLRPVSFTQGSRVSPQLAKGMAYASGGAHAVGGVGAMVGALAVVVLVMGLM